jgi:hypothetical protein
MDGKNHVSSTPHIISSLMAERAYTLNLLDNLAMNNQTTS